jgi:hypothetical protein
MQEMKQPQWEFDGSNGDTYYGLFNKWALGLHYANTNADDFICDQNTFGNFIGHTGEAYGLISDAFYSEWNDKSFVFVTNGSWNGYQTDSTSFYTIEDDIFSAICNYFGQPLAVEVTNADQISVLPNPATDSITVNSGHSELQHYELCNAAGRKIAEGTIPSARNFTLDVRHIQTGAYFLRVGNNSETFTKLIIKK